MYDRDSDAAEPVDDTAPRPLDTPVRPGGPDSHRPTTNYGSDLLEHDDPTLLDDRASERRPRDEEVTDAGR